MIFRSFYLIFPFILNELESITKYIGNHNLVNKDLAVVTSELSALSTKLLFWCHELSVNILNHMQHEVLIFLEIRRKLDDFEAQMFGHCRRSKVGR